MHYYYPVQIPGFWEQLGRNRNWIIKNSRMSSHPEPEPVHTYVVDELENIVKLTLMCCVDLLIEFVGAVVIS